MPSTVESSAVADIAALGKEWDEHHHKLLAMIRRRIHFPLKNGDEAEDILHKVYEVAHRRWPSYQQEPKASPYVWLYGLAHNQVIETFRALGRAPANENWPAESALMPPDNHTGPVTQAMRDERAALVRKIVDSLSDNDREILGMRYLDNVPTDDIAEILGIKPNALYVREFRALERFKSAWMKLTGHSNDQ